MAGKCVGELVSILFLSREIAHREHLKTKSFSAHSALGSFYVEVVELADGLAELCQGRSGTLIEDIPYYSNPLSGDIVETLKKLLEHIEEARTECYPEDSTIQNHIDSIVALYLSTIYKLTFLK